MYALMCPFLGDIAYLWYYFKTAYEYPSVNFKVVNEGYQHNRRTDREILDLFKNNS